MDVYANQKRSFAGITFRKKNNTFEETYIRMHKSGSPDGLQYNPVFNIESNWQLYPEYQAVVTTKKEGWNTFKVVVKDDLAEIYVNGKKALAVTDLKTDHKEGNIGLFALFENRFANLRVSKETPIGQVPEKEVAPIEGLITEWQLSEPRSFNAELDFSEVLENIQYPHLGKAEASGLLTISKYVVKPSRGKFRRNAEDYVVASTTIESSSEEPKLFSFDYSDRIMVFLNRKLLFKGNNGFLYKNGQYQGHLKLETNTLSLPLKTGTNTLQCVVIERANGWGLMGKLENIN